MYSIAIVDDNIADSGLLANYLRQYFGGRKENISLKVFNDAVGFLEKFTPEFDLIFLDVEMPLFSGLDVAREIRLKDENVCIVFVTSFARYAVNGYEVAAFDYFVKPVSYGQFVPKMDRIYCKISSVKSESGIFLKTDEGVRRILSADISYVEVRDHYLYYHVGNGVCRVRQSMKSAEESLRGQPFIRCNSCYLVNMKYVTGINGSELVVGDERVLMSRARKRECLQKLANFFGRR